jgi:two-component system sensor histidine kinase TctE
VNDPFGQVAVLQVEDSGPGIPETEREMVFQPFYRALGTGVDGSGLGLAIVREIAQQHDASVTIEDAREGPAGHAGEAGRGTRVTVRFAIPPDLREASPPAQPAEQEAQA